MGKKVSLVLGGGGARGLTHIGVIDALEEAGYEIVSVSGTSIGSIVGGIYCAGKFNEYKEWVLSLSKLDVVKLMDLSFSFGGIMSGEKIMSRIEDLIGEIHIEELNLPFTAVAADLSNKKEFWFQKGKLLTAMRASMAIPSVFTPVDYDGKILVDGGVVNPIPVTPTLSDHSDLTIAVSLDGARIKDNLKDEPEESIFDSALKYLNLDSNKNSMSTVDVTSSSLSMLQHTIGRYKLAATPPDLLIEVPVNICGLFDYHKAKSLIDFGRTAMEQKLEENLF
ncbi:MAG: patatin-like phospholipase family protein [Campylobacterales bacterium]|nr:patatin-like phospholipase family protein [Campylobacterales bacterium]